MDKNCMADSKNLPESIIALTTESNMKNAYYLTKKILNSKLEILNSKLAACVTLRETNSLFWWKGELQESKEVEVMIKTSENNLNELLEIIPKFHSYSTPEIIYWKASCSSDYLTWIEETTT